MFKPLQNLIDRGQWLQLDVGLYLALGREGERFGHVLAGANERPSDCNAV